MRAIVLSGGGAKGAYQIGVWKALRKLHIHYDIVTGTSVGALNGAFFVQGDYKEAKYMWENMNFNLIFSDQFSEKVLKEKGTFELLKAYMKGILKNGGMDVSRMEETMDRFISIPRFYQSKVDFGMITVNLSNLKPIEITKKEIPKEKLRDYLVASATCFPAFKIKKIDGEMYIDGGYYDNLPINLAISMGATDVIAVDLDAIGLKRKVKSLNVPITYIAPNNELGNFLIFDKDLARRAISYGYNDTMKVFGKLDGKVFTFKKYHLQYNFFKRHGTMKRELERIFKGEKKPFLDLLKLRDYEKYIKSKNQKELMDLDLNVLEYLGKTFSLDESVIYGISRFHRLLNEAFSKVEDIHFSVIEKKMKEKGKDLNYSRYVIRYLYNLILDSKKNLKVNDRLVKLAFLFHDEFLGALYLSIL